jgi:hypothetical protein
MLAHWYHIWADGAWQAPLTEHLTALDESGLGKALDARYAGVVGSPENCQAAIDALGGGWQVAVTAPDGAEEVTLRKLHASAAQDGTVLYAHTKGAYRAAPSSVLWRRRMTEYAVGMWERCAAALDDGYDCAGPHWITPEAGWPVPAPFFAGNFWWARLDFLRRLPVPGGADRWAAEQWIGQTEIPRVLNLLPIWPTDGLEAWAAGGWWGDQP